MPSLTSAARGPRGFKGDSVKGDKGDKGDQGIVSLTTTVIDVKNNGSLSTDLNTYKLQFLQKIVKAEYTGKFTSGPGRQLRVLFNGVVLLTTGSMSVSACDWIVRVTFITVNSTTIRYFIEIVVPKLGPFTFGDEITGLKLEGSSYPLVLNNPAEQKLVTGDIVCKTVSIYGVS